MSEKQRKRCPNGYRKSKDNKCVKKDSIKPTIKRKKQKKKKTIQVEPTDCQKLFEIIKSNSDLLKLETDKYFSIKKCQEDRNRQTIGEKNLHPFLYPHLDDPNFNSKITMKKEFFDTKMDDIEPSKMKNIKSESDKLCDPNREFELAPHQMFVRNFLSFQTPYKSLLLFHGLGTGKTCSSISVCEEMRVYYNQLGIKKKILIVASPAVQTNYRLQLFDHRKLKNINGKWNLKSCTGNKLINETNPMHMKGLSREKLINQIDKTINQSYEFMGYTGFSNYINSVITKNTSKKNSKYRRNKIKALRNEFSNRLIVIDEVHNIRNIDGMKNTSENFLELVTYAENMKLLLLTATPMFNDYREIIWLANLMNLNDNRFPLLISDIFDSKGNFKKDGKELLIQKLTGYVSYVQGENPFTFPYRVYPKEFKSELSLKRMMENGLRYPSVQLNETNISNPIRYLDLVYLKIGEIQQKIYDGIVENLKSKNASLNDPTKGIQYTILDGPLQSLNMTYPTSNIKKDIRVLYGKRGLERTMTFIPPPSKNGKTEYNYKKTTLSKYGRLFSPEQLNKYSSKLSHFIEHVKKSKGIVMVYSQFIDGGCVPIALALEEIGIYRYGKKNSLFKTPPVDPMDAMTMKNDKTTQYPATYVMITGDKFLSGPRTAVNNKLEINAATNENNTNGEMVKVIIISRAGSEGLDFTNIRQIHILEPWYNLNRTEQIIGRSVRNKSHCKLPFESRNVEIYLYATRLQDETRESVDLYMYRLAENKSIQIGNITRLLKEHAVDCLLNSSQKSLSEQNMNQIVDQELSSGENIRFSVGTKRNSVLCDFSDCSYKCKPNDNLPDEKDIDYSSYNENFIVMNIDKILQRIRLLFKEKLVYHKDEIVRSINAIKFYPTDQIMTALDFLITSKNEYIENFLNLPGKLINIDDYYLFQPIELDDEKISMYKKSTPMTYKLDKLSFLVPKNFTLKNKLKIQLNNPEALNDLLKDLQRDMETINDPVNKLYLYKESKREKDWVFFCSWVVDSLHKYNKIDKKILLQLAMDHIIDTLAYPIKILLASYIYRKKNYKQKNPNISQENESLIKSFFDKHIITKSKRKGIVFIDYSRKEKRLDLKISIISMDGDELVEKDRDTIAALGMTMFKHFEVKDTDINKKIGFMDIFKKTDIVFKKKNFNDKKGKYKNKGQTCSRGANKPVIIKQINELSYKKYNLSKSIILSIKDVNDVVYDKKKIIQNYLHNGSNISSRITSEQLCIENELLLRYLDHIKQDGKKWFFSTVETARNKIIEKNI